MRNIYFTRSLTKNKNEDPKHPQWILPGLFISRFPLQAFSFLLPSDLSDAHFSMRDSLLLSAAPAAGVPGTAGGEGDPSWLSGCHGAWRNLALVVPSALFVVFLASQARKSLTKLSYGRSYIMVAYYALLWFVAAFNLFWCLVQAWQCTQGKEMAWNLLSLFTTSGMMFLEISLVAFLLQGNQSSGSEALTHIFMVSGVIVAVDLLLKVIYVFGFGVPLFMDTNGSGHQVKWGLWIVHRLLLTAVYSLILLMYNTKWREKLPARPAFYNYIVVMCILNGITLLGCGLMGNGAAFGFWIHNLTTICYHSFYLPLLYVTFLADFFQEEDLYLENVYYSEMKDAGFFDGDWD